jgi:iron complex transport system permease protein
MSGAIFQSLLRNPLVAPDIVGVVSGAALAAVVLIVVYRTPSVVPLGAALGALAATVLLYALTWRGGITGDRLVLVGIALHALLTALTTLVLVRFPVEQVSAAVVWLTGTLYGTGWQQVRWLGAGLLVLVPVALALMPWLRVLEVGSDLAAALGARTQLARATLLLVAASLAAVGVAAAGAVGFVALVVPHIARLLLGPLTGGVLVVTGLLGALLVLLSDLIAQHLFSPVSLPVGVVTAAVGAPYFLFLLARTHRGGM